MEGWAMGTVWDCRDPERCVLVQRSSRHTVFPGRRQINREALRAAAAEMGWHDEDIVAQVCEGGGWKCAPSASCSRCSRSTTPGCSSRRGRRSGQWTRTWRRAGWHRPPGISHSSRAASSLATS
eukprot:5697943-Pleurochrysis_carterae.AAC.1